MSKHPKIKEQFVSASDHEDWENEYYSIKSEKTISGCLLMAGLFSIVVILGTIALLFF